MGPCQKVLHLRIAPSKRREASGLVWRGPHIVGWGPVRPSCKWACRTGVRTGPEQRYGQYLPPGPSRPMDPASPPMAAVGSDARSRLWICRSTSCSPLSFDGPRPACGPRALLLRRPVGCRNVSHMLWGGRGRDVPSQRLDRWILGVRTRTHAFPALDYSVKHIGPTLCVV